MKILKAILLITPLLLLNACAYNLNVGSKEAAAKGVTYSYDKFKSQGWLKTEVYQGGMSEPVTQYNYRASYRDNSTSPDFIQVYGKMFSQNGWCFIDAAYDELGNEYKLHKIGRNVVSDSAMGVSYVVIHEYFAIDISLGKLKELAVKDVEFKAAGKKCDSVFKVDHRVSAAFLDAIQKRIDKS